MKKILTLLVMIFCFAVSSNAQVLLFRATAFACANVYNGTYRWSDWEKSDVKIGIDLDNDGIVIDSPKRQIYVVYKTGNSWYDNKGGKQVKFYVVDQDGDRGSIRLRIDKDGTSQIYVDFSNVAWVYNVVRIN